MCAMILLVPFVAFNAGALIVLLVSGGRGRSAARRPVGPLRQTDGGYGLAHPYARGLNPFAAIRVKAGEHGQP